MGKILIVEDEESIRNGLVKIAKKTSAGLDVYGTGAAKVALKIAKLERVDAFFLDIQLEDYSGIELAKQIREMEIYKFTPIIFITAVHSKELEAFRNIHCYDYIIKPFSENEVARVFQDVNAHGIIEQKSAPIIKIKEKTFTYIVKQEDLIYVESMNRKLFIKTIYEEIDTTSYSLSKLYEQLSKQFVQCHKSFIVNLSFIKKIDRVNNILYVHKKEYPIPIGRKYKKNVWELA